MEARLHLEHPFSEEALVPELTSLLLVFTIMALIASRSSRFLPHIYFPLKVNEPLKVEIYTVPLKILKFIWMNG